MDTPLSFLLSLCKLTNSKPWQSTGLGARCVVMFVVLLCLFVFLLCRPSWPQSHKICLPCHLMLGLKHAPLCPAKENVLYNKMFWAQWGVETAILPQSLVHRVIKSLKGLFWARLYQELGFRAVEMTQPIKALAAQADDLNSIPRPHMVDGENQQAVLSTCVCSFPQSTNVS